MGISLSKLRELVMDREASRTVVHGVAESDPTKQLNWTEWLKNSEYTDYYWTVHFKLVNSTVYELYIIELYTSNGWILQYMNYILMK